MRRVSPRGLVPRAGWSGLGPRRLEGLEARWTKSRRAIALEWVPLRRGWIPDRGHGGPSGRPAVRGGLDSRVVRDVGAAPAADARAVGARLARDRPRAARLRARRGD